MRLPLLLMAMLAWLAPQLALAQEAGRAVVDASAPSDVSVTIYRDPDRAPDTALDRFNPRGFAMISETRKVTLPAGASTIRFIGVAEGMIGVTAIVTGLPGGTIEKNRNAELLSPAALVNGALGNRVTITRTDPATGIASSEDAIVRTRADGGLVLQTSDGFEAVRCSGLPERLTFDAIPAGLSASPVFSVDTRTPQGGTYEVTLTYISWGFDWEANYVGTLGSPARGDGFAMELLSWLTLVNDNAQGFDDARLQIVAGRLNIETAFQSLARPPTAAPLRLTCYPFGSTAAGTPVSDLLPPPPPPPPAMMADPGVIVVTGARVTRNNLEAAAPVAVVTAEEEDLGDLKLFRVPMRVDVSASAMKQVAFLDKDAVAARTLYRARCDPWSAGDANAQPFGADMLLVTRNEDAKGLGMALPQGRLLVFEPSSRGPMLAAMTQLRDYARGQDVELELGESAQVFAHCVRMSKQPADGSRARWTDMRVDLTNANPHPVTIRLQLGRAGEWDVRFPGRGLAVKDAERIAEIELAPNATRTFHWRTRSSMRE